MNSEKYIETTEEVIFSSVYGLLSNNFIFQQDNAPGHCLRMTKAWFQSTEIKVMGWPARNPDLNLIEKLWGRMAVQLAKKNNRKWR